MKITGKPVTESESCSVVSDSLQPHGLYSPWNFSGQNTGVGSLLQGIFPTQGSNPGLSHCRHIFLPAEPPGKPEKTGVGSLSRLQRIFPTCIAGRFFTTELPGKPSDYSTKLLLLTCGCRCSVAMSCQILCDPVSCSIPGFLVRHYFPKFTQIHVHRVSDAV